MNALLQEMLDHYAITKLLSEYCHGCDRVDQVHMASVYLEDSWDDHGSYKGPGREFAKVATESMVQNKTMCSHQLGQSLVKVTGDTACAETYFIATVRKPGVDGVEVLQQMGGRYVDTLERENGEWKIRKRLCVRDWSISHPVKDDWLRGAGFIDGQPSGRDASYAPMGIQHSGLPKQGA